MDCKPTSPDFLFKYYQVVVHQWCSVCAKLHNYFNSVLFCFLIFDIGQKKAKHGVGTCFGISFGFLAAVIISGNVARGAHRIRLFDLAG